MTVVLSTADTPLTGHGQACGEGVGYTIRDSIRFVSKPLETKAGLVPRVERENCMSQDAHPRVEASVLGGQRGTGTLVGQEGDASTC